MGDCGIAENILLLILALPVSLCAGYGAATIYYDHIKDRRRK